MIGCRTFVRYCDSLLPSTAASSSKRGSVCILTGATLPLANNSVEYVSLADFPLKYATAPYAC